jgi:hypothetical protein
MLKNIIVPKQKAINQSERIKLFISIGIKLLFSFFSAFFLKKVILTTGLAVVKREKNKTPRGGVVMFAGYCSIFAVLTQ